MECAALRARQREKRNEAARRRRAERAVENPAREALRRAKDAGRKRKQRLALRQPHAARTPDTKQAVLLRPLSEFIERKTDFGIVTCFNPTISKSTNHLTFADFQLLASRTKWLTDSIIDWHGAAVAAGLAVDKSKVRLISCSTTNVLFTDKNKDRIKYDHLSKEEKRREIPPTALEFKQLIFPVCLKGHWLAVAIQPPERAIFVYDSLKNNRHKRFEIVRATFTTYLKNQDPGCARYTAKQVTVRDQTNSDDCGIYTADRIAALLGANRGEAICVDDEAVCDYRARMFLAAGKTMFSGSV